MESSDLHEYLHATAMKTAIELFLEGVALTQQRRLIQVIHLSYTPLPTLGYIFSGYGNDVLECKKFVVSIQAIPICLKTLLLTLIRGHEEIKLALICELPPCCWISQYWEEQLGNKSHQQSYPARILWTVIITGMTRYAHGFNRGTNITGVTTTFWLDLNLFYKRKHKPGTANLAKNQGWGAHRSQGKAYNCSVKYTYYQTALDNHISIHT